MKLRGARRGSRILKKKNEYSPCVSLQNQKATHQRGESEREIPFSLLLNVQKPTPSLPPSPPSLPPSLSFYTTTPFIRIPLIRLQKYKINK